MRDEPNYPSRENENHMLDIIAELEELLATTNKALLRTHPVIEAVNKLTSMQLEMTETLIEAALHPKTDTERLHKIADAFNELTKAVEVWREGVKS